MVGKPCNFGLHHEFGGEAVWTQLRNEEAREVVQKIVEKEVESFVYLIRQY